jgi:hypothetical protein
VGVRLAVGVAVAVVVAVAVGVGVAPGEGVGVAVGSGVAVGVGVAVSSGMAVGVVVGQAPQSSGQLTQVSPDWQLPFPQLPAHIGLALTRNRLVVKNI